MNHTPTPWIVAHKTGIFPADNLGLSIATVERRRPECAESTAFIVRAVNAHDGLIAALEFIAADTRSLHPGIRETAEIALAKAREDV